MSICAKSEMCGDGEVITTMTLGVGLWGITCTQNLTHIHTVFMMTQESVGLILSYKRVRNRDKAEERNNRWICSAGL